MKYTVKNIYNLRYTGLFFLFLLVWSCDEGQTASNNQNSTTPVVASTTVKDTLTKISTTSVKPYQLEFTTYDGQWFELDYPKSFSVRKQQNEMEKDNPYRGDVSLFLTSSDKRITFFAFPIYGNSKPKGIVIDEATEDYVDNSLHQQGSTVTIRAKDGSYIREYQYDEFHFWGQQYDVSATKILYTDAFERFYQSIEATEG